MLDQEGGDRVKTGNSKIITYAGTSEALWMTNSTPSHIALGLPLELLQNIFIFLADLCLGFYPPSRPGWIAITYVCRYWRSAALCLPELWSFITIPGFSFSWSRAMVERSSPLPMRIKLIIGLYPGTRSKSLATSVLLSASRIRTLDLLGLPTDVLRFLDRLSSPSPLESLSLKVVGEGVNIDLSEVLFDRNAPHLHRLTLKSSACIRAPLWLLAGITHFTINGGFSLHELFDTLQEMPQLEMLYIRDGIVESEQVLSHVVLLRLSILFISDSDLRRPVMIFSHIDAPPTLRKHLHMSLDSPWERFIDTFPAAQSLIPHDTAPGVNNGGLRVAKVTGGPMRGSFDVWSRTSSENASADAAAFAHKDALFLLSIEWMRYHDISYFEPYSFFRLERLCSHFCTARIEELTTIPEIPVKSRTDMQDELDAPDPVVQWQALLSALPSVKTLRLHRGSTTCISLLSALYTSAGLLPLLQKIFVTHSMIRYAAAASAEGCDGVGNPGAEASSAMANPHLVKENMAAELVDVLSRRSGLEVVLIECEVDEEALGALRERARVRIENECIYNQAYM